jgi:hypothetical protein
MPVINVNNFNSIGVTVDPSKWVAIPDTWTQTYAGADYAILKADGKIGQAINFLLQGQFISTYTGSDICQPYTFGGLTPDNSANGYTYPIGGQYGVSTTMPNQQSPLVNYIYSEGQFLVEIIAIIDDNTIMVRDIDGVTDGIANAGLKGLSTNSYPLRNATLDVTVGASCFVFTPGKLPQFVPTQGMMTFDQNNYGEITPVMVASGFGDCILIYNE